MSGRGELVTFTSPLAAVRSALDGRYTAVSSGGTEIAARDELDKLVCRIGVRAFPGDSFWLTLDPLRGYTRDADRIRERLLAAGFQSEEGWRSPRVEIAADERADVVVARVLRRLLEIQDANLPAALADADAEFLHDYRVAIRRTRAVLREMRGVFDPEELAHIRASLKWLQAQTSATRDLDVCRQDLQELRGLARETVRADLDPIGPLLHERRRRARAAMEQALTSDRARALRAECAELLPAPVLADEQRRPDAARPIAELARVRIRRVHRRMLAMGRAITPASRPQEYHELRKRGKELRYLLELFGLPLFGAEVVEPMIRVLKGLQDVLGRHQDREVQIAMLRELGDELVARPGGAAALIAIGTLIDRLQAEASDARGRFTAAFAEFASEAQCRLVKKAFG